MDAMSTAECRPRGRPGQVLRGLALLVGLVLVAVSCQQLPTDSGVEALDAPRRWWNYYRRGLEYSLAGDWQRASVDFEIALGQRRGALFGRDREQRRAKTYGLHMLDDYFPHRELGVCRFRLGQFEAAERELRISLDQLPSARAQYYLNEVRRAALQPGMAAGAGPEIRIDQAPSAAGLILVNQLWLELTGTLSSPAYVAQVTVNGRALPMELAEAEYRLSEVIALAPGEQDVTVDAEDLLGRQGHWRGRVAVDQNGPEIAVARPAGSPAGDVLVTVSDDRGLVICPRIN